MPGAPIGSKDDEASEGDLENTVVPEHVRKRTWEEGVPTLSEGDLENTVVPEHVRKRTSASPRSSLFSTGPSRQEGDDLEETKRVRSASSPGPGFGMPIFTGSVSPRPLPVEAAGGDQGLEPGEGHPRGPPPERRDSPAKAVPSLRRAPEAATGTRQPPVKVPPLNLGTSTHLDSSGDAFLTGADLDKGADKNERVADSSLIWYCTLGGLLCITAFTFMTLMRLEDRHLQQHLPLWPLYVDFLCLWLLPFILFVFALEFSRTHIKGDGAQLARAVVVATSFLCAVLLLFLGVCVCIKINGLIDWSWSIVILPLWPLILVCQVVLLFVAPGFVRSGMLLELFLIFGQLWGGFLTALLICLKLDGDLLAQSWYKIFLPLQIPLLLQALAFFFGSEDQLEEGLHDALLAFFVVFLALRLDMTITWSWVWVFAPMIVSLLWSLEYVLLHHEHKSEEKLRSERSEDLSSSAHSSKA